MISFLYMIYYVSGHFYTGFLLCDVCAGRLVEGSGGGNPVNRVTVTYMFAGLKLS